MATPRARAYTVTWATKRWLLSLFRLDGRAAQGLAVTHQLVQTIRPSWDLADHPGLQHKPSLPLLSSSFLS